MCLDDDTFVGGGRETKKVLLRLLFLLLFLSGEKERKMLPAISKDAAGDEEETDVQKGI